MAFSLQTAAIQRLQVDTAERELFRQVCEIRTQQNALAPISCLPVEVFVAIILLYREASYLPQCLASPRDRHCDLRLSSQPSRHGALLVLCRVCKAWNTLVKGTPLLWDHIDLTHPRSVAPTLRLCRGVEISVEAAFNRLVCSRVDHEERYRARSYSIKSQLQSLLSGPRRIRHLDLEVPMLQLRIAATKLVVDHTRFLSLRSLRVIAVNDIDILTQSLDYDYDSDSDSDDLDEDAVRDWNYVMRNRQHGRTRQPLSCPLLRSLSIKGASIPAWMDFSSASHLTVLNIDFSTLGADGKDAIPSLLRLLHDVCSSVVDISLVLCSQDISVASSSTQGPPIHLPKLERLTVQSCQSAQLLRLLPSLEAPDSRCLLDFDDVDELVQYVNASTVTAEWKAVLGEYTLWYLLNDKPAISIFPREPTSISTIVYPILRYNQDFFHDVRRDRAPSRAAMVQIGEHLISFAPITELSIDITRFNGNVSHQQVHRQRRLTDTLEHFSFIRTLRLEGLTGSQAESYLGQALGIPDHKQSQLVRPKMVCKDLQYLEIRLNPAAAYQRYGENVDLLWLPQLVASRLNAVEPGADVKPLDTIVVALTVPQASKNTPESEQRAYVSKVKYDINKQLREAMLLGQRYGLKAYIKESVYHSDDEL